MGGFAQGERVRIGAGGRAVEARLLLESRQGKALAVCFEGIVAGYAGFMPLLLGTDGIYRTLDCQVPVRVERLSETRA